VEIQASIDRSQNLNFAIGSNHLRALLGSVGPAVGLPLSPAGTTVTDLPGWGNTRWGMSLEQVRQTLKLRESPTPPPAEYRLDGYESEYYGPLYPAFVLRLDVDGYEYKVALSSNRHSHTLQQVYFSPQHHTQDHTVNRRAFSSLKVLLTQKYGMPSEREEPLPWGVGFYRDPSGYSAPQSSVSAES